VKVVLLGDSITAGYPGGPSNPDPFDYGYRKKALLDLDSNSVAIEWAGTQNYHWENLKPIYESNTPLHHEGVGGITIDGQTARIEQAFSKLGNIGIVHILLGTNNLAKDTVDQIIEKMKLLKSKIQSVSNSKSSEIIIGSLPYANGFLPKVNEINDKLKSSFPNEFYDMSGRFNHAYNAGGSKSVLFDSVHPNANGYALLSQSLVERIGAKAIITDIPISHLSDLKPPFKWITGKNFETIVTDSTGYTSIPILSDSDRKLFLSNVVDRWGDLAILNSARYGIPSIWIEGFIWAESNGKATAINKEVPPGVGLMQLTENESKAGHSDQELLNDPTLNVQLGVKILADDKKLLGGSYSLPDLASMYNAGPGGYKAKSATDPWRLKNKIGYIGRVVTAANTALGIVPKNTKPPIITTPNAQAEKSSVGPFLLAAGGVVGAFLLSRR